MSQQRSQLVSAVRLLCGEPADEPLPNGLPSNLIFEELTNIESEMLRDVDLSNQNRRVAKEELALVNADEPFGITASDFNAPSYVYLQTDASTNYWWPVEIVNHSALMQYASEGKLAIAFSGTPVQGYLSWVPEGNQTLRIWYDRSGNDNPTMSGSTEIGNLYDTYLKIQAAAQCREHLGLPVGEVLKSRLVKSESQWQRFVGMSRQQGLAEKPRVFTPPRCRRRYVGVDRTRFFVP